ncbi:RidA family protein [Cupriavidus pauculus]|uniref:RidA family protein n=1 Tax=Cupriavidus pauculus TaxID=82633 RepID=UPI000783913E|nr:RidA family protein [Cupriavidus pauculus]MBY4732982.1 RidA family protein [Cupriavidus pauculus]
MQLQSPRAPYLEFINPPDLYDPRLNGYSHVAVAHRPVRIVFAAGQGGEDMAGGLRADFVAQVNQALANLRIALQAAGADIPDIAKVTVLVVDHSMERLAIFSRAWQALLGDWPAPACTLIPVPRLALDGMLFEIEAIAVLPE